MNSLVRLVLPDVQDLLKEGTQAEIATALAPFHSADIADLIEELADDEAQTLLLGLSAEQRVDTFEHLEPDQQVRLADLVGSDAIAGIVEEMSPDDRADLMNSLPADAVSGLMARLSAEDAKDVAVLRNYDQETAGGRMTSEFVRLSVDMTAAEAIERIREEAPDAETILALYVLGADERIQGVLSLTRLILAPPTTPVSEIMYTNPISVPVDSDQEKVVQQLRHYDFVAMPVVDGQGKMVGIVTHDDALDVAMEEQTEDLQKMAGVEPLQAPYFATSVGTLIRKRATWLMVLFGAGLIAGTVLKGFDEILERNKALIFFLPLIIAAGGNSGSQSATLVIRGLAVGEMKSSDWWLIARRELVSGLALGGLLGVLGLMTAWVWNVQLVGPTVCLTLVAIVTAGSLLGSLLPIGLQNAGIDPAITSSPMVAALVDILGILFYVTIAGILLLQP